MKFKPAILLIFIIVLQNPLFSQDEQQPADSIDVIFDEFFREIIKRNPELATQLGLTPEMGYEYDPAALTDVSIAAEEGEFALFRDYHSRLQNFPVDELPQKKRKSALIFRAYLEQVLSRYPFRYHYYTIDPMFGTHYQLTNVMTEYHRIDSLQDAENYITRLQHYPQRIDDVLQGLAVRERLGIYPPRFLVAEYHRLLDEFVNMPAHRNALFTAFNRKLDKVAADREVKQALRERVTATIRSSVYPAYRKLIDHVAKIEGIADNDAGVWKLPDGDAFYEHCLWRHTTTDLSPEDIHKLGLKEVSRIQKEMKKLYSSVGVKGGKTFGETANKYRNWLALQTEDDFYYPYTETGRESALRDYKAILSEAEQRLPELFSEIPKSKVTVKRVPGHLEMSAGNYYNRQTLDGQREAAFYTNLNRLPFKPGMQTLIYHETVPGHHFQIAIAQENAGQEMFRHLTHFTGYIEGWALYAEKLAYENGWFGNVHSQLGYLQSELFRAVRLVVDTGLHREKWSREQAFQFMRDNLGWGSYREIDRYILLPGQACAYKIGELKILELRKFAKDKLDEQFDLKKFHKVVLENGTVPLSLLEQFVEEYIGGN